MPLHRSATILEISPNFTPGFSSIVIFRTCSQDETLSGTYKTLKIVCCLITYIGREENVRCDQLLAIELLSSRSLRAVYGTDAEKLILSRTGLSDEKVLFIDDYIVVSPAMKLLCRFMGFTISFVFQNMKALKPNGFISSKMWF